MKKQILRVSTFVLLTLSIGLTSCKKDSKDEINPTVALNGEATRYWQVGKAYSDPGAIGHDETDGTLAATASGTVNANVVGTYVVTYTAKDAAGNKGTVTRTVYVVNFDGSYNLVQSNCTDVAANGSGGSTVDASGVTPVEGMTISNFGLYSANTENASFSGTSITVPIQSSATGVPGDQIEGSGTISGLGTASSPLKFTFQFKEKDAAGVIFNEGTAVFTHL